MKPKPLPMKSLIICMVVMLGSVQAGMAQRFSQDERDALRERVEAQRIAFITQKLELSPEESEKFWPVYNAFKKSEQEKRKSARPNKPFDDLSDDEARDIIKRHLTVEAEMVELKRQFMDDVMEILPPRRALRLNMIEAEFNRGVLERLQQARGKKGPSRD